jgi:hypothetical protein
VKSVVIVGTGLQRGLVGLVGLDDELLVAGLPIRAADFEVEKATRLVHSSLNKRTV